MGCSANEEKKASHFKKGQTYFEKGDYKSAELEFRNAIQIDPEFVAAYESLGETYLRLVDPHGAFREYFKVAKLDPQNTKASLKLATFFLLAKKTRNPEREWKHDEYEWATTFLPTVVFNSFEAPSPIIKSMDDQTVLYTISPLAQAACQPLLNMRLPKFSSLLGIE